MSDGGSSGGQKGRWVEGGQNRVALIGATRREFISRE